MLHNFNKVLWNVFFKGDSGGPLVCPDVDGKPKLALDWFRLGTKDVQTLLCLQKFLFTKNGSTIDKYHNLRTIFNRNAFRNKAFYHVNEFWVIINVVKVMCFELIFIKCHIIANRQLLNLSCLTMQSNAT